jgi:ketosteroid isomerase-like protein
MTSTSDREAIAREFWRVWKEEGVERVLARYEEFFADDGVWSPPISRITGQDYIGRSGFADYVRDFQEAFESFDGEIETSEDIDGGLVRAVLHVSAVHAAGGALEATLIALTRVQDDGRAAYAWGTYDPEEAATKLAELRAVEADA